MTFLHIRSVVVVQSENKIVLESDGVKKTCTLRDPKQGENNWIIDKDIPIFKGDNREYIEQLVNVGEI